MAMTDTQNHIQQLMAQVEAKYGMGGLSSGVYGEFTADVAQAVARKCRDIALQTTEQGAPDDGCETKAYATAAEIESCFGLETPSSVG